MTRVACLEYCTAIVLVSKSILGGSVFLDFVHNRSCLGNLTYAVDSAQSPLRDSPTLGARKWALSQLQRRLG